MVGHRVVAVAGAKGGVGKTTTSINLGAALAAEGRSALVVETDLAMANAFDFLDIDARPSQDSTLHDVLAGEATPETATYAAPGGFDVLPSGTSLDGFARTDADDLERVVTAVRQQYDYVLLDTGAGLSHETLLPLGLADETLVVSTPRLAAVRDAEKTVTLTDRVGGTVVGAVFTMSGTGRSPPVHSIAAFLDVELFGHVPEDGAVPASQDAGVPVVARAPESAAADGYRRIAARLDERASEGGAADPARVEANLERARRETARHRGGFEFVDDAAAPDGSRGPGERDRRGSRNRSSSAVRSSDAHSE